MRPPRYWTCSSPQSLRRPQNVARYRAHIDPWGPGDHLSPSRMRHPRPFCNPETSCRRTRARLHPHRPSLLLLACSLVGVFRRLSLARPPHTRASRHGPSQRKRLGFRPRARASGALDGADLFFERRRRASRGLMPENKPQAAHLIAIINGRTYIRYALGLRTGLSQDASS